MSEIAALLKRVTSLAKRANRSESTVSKWLFRDANTIRRLRSGGDVTVTTLLRAKDELRRRELLHPERQRGRRGSA